MKHASITYSSTIDDLAAGITVVFVRLCDGHEYRDTVWETMEVSTGNLHDQVLDHTCWPARCCVSVSVNCVVIYGLCPFFLKS